jgi:hypothetical protein
MFMKIEMLGTRGNVDVSAKGYERQSGIFIDDRILLDLGEKEYLNLHPDYIFISHLHPDHAVFEQEDLPPISIPVYAPESSSQQQVTILSDSVTVDSYMVTPFPTIHSTRVKSMALLVRKESSVFYTSDVMEVIPELEDPVDVVIIDGSFMRRGGLIRRSDSGKRFGHTGISDLVQTYAAYTDYFLVTHFGTWFYRDIEQSIDTIESLGNGTTVRAAHDGMIVHP